MKGRKEGGGKGRQGHGVKGNDEGQVRVEGLKGDGGRRGLENVDQE